MGNPDYVRKFFSYIKERLDLVRNPSFLVLVLGQLDVDRMETKYRGIRMWSADVEDDTGHGDSFLRQNSGDLKQLDLPAITKSVHALAATIALGESKVKTSLLRLERLAEFNKRSQDARSLENSLERDSNVQELRQHIQWQGDALRSMLYEFENCAKAATSQMSIVGRKFYNAHQDLGF